MPATLEAQAERRHTSESNIKTPPLGEGISRAMEIFRSGEPLPITKHADEISRAIDKSRVIILDAETGSGKSTAGVVMIANEMLKKDPNAQVLVTQPTKIAAAGVANYLRKSEQDKGIGMGNLVGYRFRGAREVASETRIQYAMEQAVFNEILKNPTLDGTKALFLDEIHLNSTNLTAIMALLKPIMAERERKGNPLWVVLASATMDVEAVKNYYPTAEHVKVEGRTFKVERKFAEAPIEPDDRTRALAERVVQILTEMDPNNHEDIIGFLPGRAEIDEAYDLVKKLLPPDLKIDLYKIMGGEDSEESTKAVSEKGENPAVFIMSDAGKTSLTRPGRMRVVDSGLTRTMVYDPATKLHTLVTIPSSQDDADQRAGRAGRTEPGIAESLNTREEYNKSEKSLPPEIVRVPPIRQILLLKRHGINIESLDLFAQPGKESMADSLNYLKKLGALSGDGSITTEGEEMADIEADPHFARMIVEARKLGCEDAVTLLVGLMQNPKDSVFRWERKGNVSFRDKFKKYIEPETTPRSDIIPILRAWNEYIQQPFASKNDANAKTQRKLWSDATGIRTRILNNASKTRKEILRNRNFIDKPIDLTDDNIARILQSVAIGLLDRTLIRRDRGEYQTLEGTKGVRIGNGSVLYGSEPEAIISGNIFKSEKSPNSYASLNIEMTLDNLMSLAPHLDLNPSSKEAAAIHQENHSAHTTSSEHAGHASSSHEHIPHETQHGENAGSEHNHHTGENHDHGHSEHNDNHSEHTSDNHGHDDHSDHGGLHDGHDAHADHGDHGHGHGHGHGHDDHVNKNTLWKIRETIKFLWKKLKGIV